MTEAPQPATGTRPLGEILVEDGALSAEALARALEHGRKCGLKLGQALLELGLVDEARLTSALERQGRLYCIELSSAIVDPACAQLLERGFSVERRCLAINRIAGVTTVAMEDPSDVETLEEVARRTGAPVLAVHADARRIEECVEEAFAAQLDELPESTDAPDDEELRFPLPARESERFFEEEGVEGPVGNLIQRLLGEALEARASALHFEPRERRFVVRMRVDGALHERLSLARSWARPVVARLKHLCELELAASGRPQEASARSSFRGEEVALHATTAPTAHGESLVLRVEGRRARRRELAELGLEPEDEARLREWIGAGRGLLLVAGPRGSGRRTTLRALLSELDRPERKLVAIERHPQPAPEGTTVIALQGEQRRADALRAALEQDADVLALDELDDAESARLALGSALEGRLVLAATSAGDPGEALARLTALGLEPRLVAEALAGVVAQRLVRRSCAACAPEDAAECRECRASGFRGRAALLELAPLTDELRAALRGDEDARALRAAALAAGARSLRAAGLARVERGETTRNEVLANTPEDP